MLYVEYSSFSLLLLTIYSRPFLLFLWRIRAETALCYTATFDLFCFPNFEMSSMNVDGSLKAKFSWVILVAKRKGFEYVDLEIMQYKCFTVCL